MVTSFLFISLIFLSIGVVAIIVEQAISQKSISIPLCLFLVLPVGQIFMLHSFSFHGWSLYWILGLAFSFGANILFLLYAISHQKKTAAAEELKEIQHQLALEQSHFQAIEQRQKEIELIREDFNKKLTIVSSFVNSAKQEEAYTSVVNLANSINCTKETMYCAIPVINALLTQKEQVCNQLGIELIVTLALPPSLTIKPIHLCSIFGNILDNAIGACTKIETSQCPTIHLSSRFEGDYLFIKVTNPSINPAASSLPGRGYGQQIIKEIVKLYEGDFHKKYSNGVYTAIISLVIVER